MTTTRLLYTVQCQDAPEEDWRRVEGATYDDPLEAGARADLYREAFPQDGRRYGVGSLTLEICYILASARMPRYSNTCSQEYSMPGDSQR